jgi:hypothetical protein
MGPLGLFRAAQPNQHDLIQHRSFRLTLLVVLELFLLALPCVSPEHRRQNREKAVGSFLGESERDSEKARHSQTGE